MTGDTATMYKVEWNDGAGWRTAFCPDKTSAYSLQATLRLRAIEYDAPTKVTEPERHERTPSGWGAALID